MGALARQRNFSLLTEYRDARFGDARLTYRLMRLVAALSVEPRASFPVAAKDDAELEATYRFLNNERVTADQIMAPHQRRTVERCGDAKRVVVAHDTTEFNFGKSAREDLGRVGRGKSFGFYGHFALAIANEELRHPLGVLGFEIHSRDGNKGRQRSHIALQTDATNESKRWLTMVERSAQALGDCPAIHLMDREGDSYALMASLVEHGHRFVIRMAGAKRPLVDAAEATVGEMLHYAPVVAEREVPITARGRNLLPSYRKAHPERRGRLATLQISSIRVILARPDSSNRSPHRTLTLNVVHVVERDPPEGEVPIEWRLWTTEPVGTAAEALAVVDDYCCRWMIEEFFKALKSGCAIESRQLESHDGLVNALAVFVPVAWRLLMLRTLSRNHTEQPATEVLSPVQIRCLAAALKEKGRPPLPKKPTVRDAMLGVAGLGGHIKNNGDPGWIVLGRGLDKLLTIELGYRLASDQM
jgi:Transposase DNA-binding/Transposase DDE domain